MEDLGAARRATEESCATLLTQLEHCKAVLRAKGTELEARSVRLKSRQIELAEKHGGAHVKGTDKLKLNVGGTRVTKTTTRAMASALLVTCLECLLMPTMIYERG